MTLRRTLATLAVALTAAAPLAVPIAPATSGTPETLYFTMTGTGQEHPREIFLTANAGPYLKRLTWTDWGEDVATAEGIYRSDCASCAPPRRRTATVRFSEPISCGDGVQAYSKGVVTVSRPDRGRHKRTFRIHMGCAPE
jgi:hypothetical protein